MSTRSTPEWRASSSAAALQRNVCEGKFDVLTGSEQVSREVRARAIILARLRATNSHSITAPARWIGYRKLRVHRGSAQVLDVKGLFLTKLLAQFSLPLSDR